MNFCCPVRSRIIVSTWSYIPRDNPSSRHISVGCCGAKRLYRKLTGDCHVSSFATIMITRLADLRPFATPSLSPNRRRPIVSRTPVANMHENLETRSQRVTNFTINELHSKRACRRTSKVRETIAETSSTEGLCAPLTSAVRSAGTFPFVRPGTESRWC